MAQQISYIICTSPRSGSTMLATGLWQTNIAGRPAEYFHSSIQIDVTTSKRLGVTSDREYMEKVKNVSTTENGVFGMKLHAYQTRFLISKIEHHRSMYFPSLREAIETEFPGVRYIFLRRENDKVKQAVSYYRALLTNEWWRFRGKNPPPEDSTIEYYELGIRKCLDHITESDTYWEQYFLKHGLSPLRLTFEEITGDYEGAIRRTLSYLGLPCDIPIAPPATVKISNDRSLVWEKKFLEDQKLSGAPAFRTVHKMGAPF